jgi:hypothetical protein
MRVTPVVGGGEDTWTETMDLDEQKKAWTNDRTGETTSVDPYAADADLAALDAARKLPPLRNASPAILRKKGAMMNRTSPLPGRLAKSLTQRSVGALGGASSFVGDATNLGSKLTSNVLDGATSLVGATTKFGVKGGLKLVRKADSLFHKHDHDPPRHKRSVDALFEHLKYDWYGGGSGHDGGFGRPTLRERYRAVFQTPSWALNADAEVLDSFIDDLDRYAHPGAIANATIDDMMNFFYVHQVHVNGNEGHDHAGVQYSVDWIGDGFMTEALFMDPETMVSYQIFFRRVLAVLAPLLAAAGADRHGADRHGVGSNGAGSKGGSVAGGDGLARLPGDAERGVAPRRVPGCLCSEDGARALFAACLAQANAHLPRTERAEDGLVSWTDPFGPLEDVREEEEVWIFPAMVRWAMLGYYHVMRMCLPAAHGAGADAGGIHDGLAFSHDEGLRFAAHFRDAGFDVAQLAFRDEDELKFVFGHPPDGPDGRDPDPKPQRRQRHMRLAVGEHAESAMAAQIDDQTHHDDVVLPSYWALRRGRDLHALDHFAIVWEHCVVKRFAMSCRLRRPIVKVALRRELTFIEGIRLMQGYWRQQMSSLVITLGVTLGSMFASIVAPYIADWMGLERYVQGRE